MYTGSWRASPLTGRAQIQSCRGAPKTHTQTHTSVWGPNICVIPACTTSAALRLTCSLLQLSAAETMISSWSKCTSESRFKQMAEEVCTFVVSHNCVKKERQHRLLEENNDIHQADSYIKFHALSANLLTNHFPSCCYVQRQTANNLSATIKKSSVSLLFSRFTDGPAAGK